MGNGDGMLFESNVIGAINVPYTDFCTLVQEHAMLECIRNMIKSNNCCISDIESLIGAKDGGLDANS